MIGHELEFYILIGELSLDGSLQPVKGVLHIALRTREEKYKGLNVPVRNSREADVVDGLDLYVMESLGDVTSFCNGLRKFEPVKVLELLFRY